MTGRARRNDAKRIAAARILVMGLPFQELGGPLHGDLIAGKRKANASPEVRRAEVACNNAKLWKSFGRSRVTRFVALACHWASPAARNHDKLVIRRAFR